jgi:UDP-N-acetylmuramoylalanine--D-glutamate ligase
LSLENKKVLVVGLAKTGLATARFLKNQGAKTIVADIMTEGQLGPYAKEARALGISLELGPHRQETFTSCDVIIVSPGVPVSTPALESARRKGIEVIGEIELAARYIMEPIVAITGTNGKTTTTTLVGEMLKASGIEVYVGGNIGEPLIAYVDKGMRAEVIVAEISSFQLDTTKTFCPRVGVLLNITEDHLDRYVDFEGYVRSKGKLFANQKISDVAILNQADDSIRSLVPSIQAAKFYFNIKEDCSGPEDICRDASVYGTRINDRQMICLLPEKGAVVLSLEDFKARGLHNLENAAAASLASLMVGADISGIQRVLNTFEGMRHRLEYIRTVKGISYYNDSKATNVGAVARALESFDVPVILIMGGRDKGGSYSLLEKFIPGRVKRLIVMGEAREKIMSALGPLTSSKGATDLEEAVRVAAKGASRGDSVLLSPGCSSFDMFSDYAERGEAFRRIVEKL